MQPLLQPNPQQTLQTNKSNQLTPLKKLSFKHINHPQLITKSLLHQKKNSSTKRSEVVQKISLPLKQFQYRQTIRSIKKSKSQLKFKQKQTSYKSHLKGEKMPIQIIKDKIQLQKYMTKRKSLTNSARSGINIENNSTNNENNSNQNNINYFNKTIQTFHIHDYYTNSGQKQHLTARQILELKQKLYKPKLNMFQRFNYQNYQNYEYKNPFVKHKYESLHRDKHKNVIYEFPKNSKYKVNQGSSKNLQIVFVQTKYQDFVKKTNEILQQEQAKALQMKISQRNSPSALSQQFQIIDGKQIQKKTLKKFKRSLVKSQIKDSRDLFNQKNMTKWNYSHYKKQSDGNTQKNKTQPKSDVNFLQRKKSWNNSMLLKTKTSSKSTLVNLLQTFRTLQKISQLQQNEQRPIFNSKSKNIEIHIDFSKTVLIDVIINKYSFLKNLNKSFRMYLLRVLFQINIITEYTKISIHDFLRFMRILVIKDASIEELALFVYKLFFLESEKINYAAGKKVLQRINKRDKKKLQIIDQYLYQILNQLQQNEHEILVKFNSSPFWLHSVIDYLTNQ